MFFAPGMPWLLCPAPRVEWLPDARGFKHHEVSQTCWRNPDIWDLLAEGLEVKGRELRFFKIVLAVLWIVSLAYKKTKPKQNITFPSLAKGQVTHLGSTGITNIY